MPELPEVERVRLMLRNPLDRARVTRVRIRRRDVALRPGPARPATHRDLLQGASILALHRHGKQLAIKAADGRTICVQLGMSGGLFLLDDPSALATLTHAHVVWNLGPPGASGRTLVFRDPRRFGGITCYPTMEALRRERWSALGPDALSIEPSALADALRGARRPVKSALLDQSVLAGVGNIYADESLFMARISPTRTARTLSGAEIDRLAESIRRVLADAICAGGSSIRDYKDAAGEEGSFQKRHQVYGRAGRACTVCGSRLRTLVVAQRTTVMCPLCQRRSSTSRTPGTYLSTSCARRVNTRS